MLPALAIKSRSAVTVIFWKAVSLWEGDGPLRPRPSFAKASADKPISVGEGM